MTDNKTITEYTCQYCGHKSVDKTEFKLLAYQGIAWVGCIPCIDDRGFKSG